jgi:hypothetical protein
MDLLGGVMMFCMKSDFALRGSVVPAYDTVLCVVVGTRCC